MYCLQCGRAMTPGAAKCPECGAAADPSGYCGGFWGLVGQPSPQGASDAGVRRTGASAAKKRWLPALCAAMAVIMLLELGTILLLHRKLNRVRQSQQTQTEYTTQPEPAQPEWTPVTDVQPEYWSEAQPGTEPADPTDADPGSRIDPEPGVPSDWQAPPGDPTAEQGG